MGQFRNELALANCSLVTTPAAHGHSLIAALPHFVMLIASLPHCKCLRDQAFLCLCVSRG